MSKSQSRLYTLYGDTVEVSFIYDEALKRYFGDYPDFEETPRITPCGRRWVNATKENCPFADENYGDCGSCEFFKCEKEGDLIGICDNEQLLTLRKDDMK